MQEALLVFQIAVGIVLVAVVMLQGKGGGLGGIMGGDSSMFRTRRGLERLLFRFTVVWATLFVILSMVTAKVWSVPVA